MRYLQRLILHPRANKVFLGLLAIAYVGYLVVFGRSLGLSLPGSSGTIIVHQVDTNAQLAIMHWTATNMRDATNADEQIGSTSNLTQENTDSSTEVATRQEGQLPRNGESSYPLSTVGKVFFTNASGQDMVCSGTALSSANQSVVDTAGHCLYWNNNWVHNMIFCPLYDNGDSRYGCWAARDLEAPSEWINHPPNDYHQDFGMAIVAPNSEGTLTDVVGGAGWAYNQPVNQLYSAYGYPAGYPYDGQTRQSCEGASGTSWKHGGGTVVSIPCGMTGGSSGGPWFIQSGGKWYLNGHNDFTSILQPGHMFSPYYDDTWYALYQKAQDS